MHKYLYLSYSFQVTHLRDIHLQGCEQVGRALNLPATAILGGYIILGGFILSPSVVKVPDNDWTEQILVWLTIAMPTGSGKSTLFRHLYTLMRAVR